MQSRLGIDRPAFTRHCRRFLGFSFVFFLFIASWCGDVRAQTDAPEDAPSPVTGVRFGIDTLEEEAFAPLSGMRIGLITNHTGQDAGGRSTISLFQKAPGMTLACLFTPEHGLTGKRDEKISSQPDSPYGVPVYSLYGETLRPTPHMLEGIDALVFDIQDAGVRFYTYITTMAFAMEAAAAKGIPFFVLDRPNPLTASSVHGPVMDPELKSFTGYYPLPLRHGMTVGELALLFNAENRIGADLRVIPMQRYRRTDWHDETGHAWVPPSPNLRTLTQAVLYPGVAVVESANVSVGRGTATPFELFGAPWIEAKKLARYLKKRKIKGVRFSPVEFTPRGDRFEGKHCKGVKIELIDRDSLDPALLGVEISSALAKLFPRHFHVDDILPMIGSRSVLAAIRRGADPLAISSGWKKELEQFSELRGKYLLY